MQSLDPFTGSCKNLYTMEDNIIQNRVYFEYYFIFLLTTYI